MKSKNRYKNKEKTKKLLILKNLSCYHLFKKTKSTLLYNA